MSNVPYNQITTNSQLKKKTCAQSLDGITMRMMMDDITESFIQVYSNGEKWLTAVYNFRCKETCMHSVRYALQRQM